MEGFKSLLVLVLISTSVLGDTFDPYDRYELRKWEDLTTTNDTLHIWYTDIDTESLCMLSDLEQVGQLIIHNNAYIRTLKCLRNLKSITDPDLAVDIYSNFNKNNQQRLCYADLVNWTKIVKPTAEVHVKLVGNECPTECHPTCDGCWGAGPRLCQDCKYYRSGITCVETCPLGTTVDEVNKLCLEKHPDAPKLTIGIVDGTSIELDWTGQNTSHNGIPLGYRLWMNHTMIWEQEVDDYLETTDGMTESILETIYVADGLSENETYFFELQVRNNRGWSQLTQVDPLSPHRLDIVDLHINISNHTPNSFNISWHPETVTDITEYWIEVEEYNPNYYNDESWHIYHLMYLNDTVTSHIVTDLYERYEYRVRIGANNVHGFDKVSGWQYVRLPNGKPTRVAWLNATHVTETSIHLKWTESEQTNQFDAVDNYLIIVFGITRGDYVNLLVNHTVTSVWIQNITSNSSYWCLISPVNEYGYGWYQWILVDTLEEYNTTTGTTTPTITGTTTPTITGTTTPTITGTTTTTPTITGTTTPTTTPDTDADVSVVKNIISITTTTTTSSSSTSTSHDDHDEHDEHDEHDHRTDRLDTPEIISSSPLTLKLTPLANHSLSEIIYYNLIIYRRVVEGNNVKTLAPYRVKNLKKFNNPISLDISAIEQVELKKNIEYRFQLHVLCSDGRQTYSAITKKWTLPKKAESKHQVSSSLIFVICIVAILVGILVIILTKSVCRKYQVSRRPQGRDGVSFENPLYGQTENVLTNTDELYPGGYMHTNPSFNESTIDKDYIDLDNATTEQSYMTVGEVLEE